jgi:hypothetical protein
VRRYEAAPKWKRAQLDGCCGCFQRPSLQTPVRQRTIKGDRSFETREEALEHSHILVLQIRGAERWAAALKQKVDPKAADSQFERRRRPPELYHRTQIDSRGMEDWPDRVCPSLRPPESADSGYPTSHRRSYHSVVG